MFYKITRLYIIVYSPHRYLYPIYHIALLYISNEMVNHINYNFETFCLPFKIVYNFLLKRDTKTIV